MKRNFVPKTMLVRDGDGRDGLSRSLLGQAGPLGKEFSLIMDEFSLDHWMLDASCAPRM
jgi:hypothetical protein